MGALAQSVPLSHQAWSTEEGLPDASVHQVFQSRDGYIWLATEGGVARFDGVGFKVFRRENDPAFASNDVSSIAQDAAGALWFGTADGLVQMRGSQERRFTESDGLPSSAVLAMSVVGDEPLVVQTAQGLAQFNGTSFKVVDPSSPIADFLVRNIDGVIRARRQKLFPGKRITVVYLAHHDVWWTGTNRGLFVDSLRDMSPHEIEALRNDSVLCVYQDREGNIWVGTESSGLHVLRPRKFRSESAAAGEAVSAVMTASDGAVWFGTRGSGVHVIHKGVAGDAMPASSLTSPVVLSLAPGPHGDVWVGTPDGVNHVEGKSVHQYTSANGMPDDFVRSLLVGVDGDVWAGTRGGLAHIDGDKVTTYARAEGLGSDSIGPLLQAGPHDLLVGTSAGLSHVRDGHIESFVPEAQSHIVTAITKSAEEIWVGVHGDGLSLFSNGHFHHVESASVPKEIVALATDNTGALWMRGERGVYRSSLNALRDCAQSTQSCSTLNVGMFDTADGMPNALLVSDGSPSMWRAADGELWFATRKGIAVADPAHLPINQVPPPVVIQRFVVDGVDRATSGDEIAIDPGHSRFTFEYAALSYTAPSKNRYRYMLEGFDRGWIDAGTTRTAYYTSLPAKKYTFRVQAENNDGVWNETGATVSFRLMPPLYRRWWFYLMLALLVGALAFAIYRLRVQAIQRRFDLVLNERNRMAREIHDTLAQDFVSVSLQLDLLSNLLKTKQVDEASGQLRETRKLVKDGLEAARQSIWNLRANIAKDSLPTLLTQLVERYAQTSHAPKLKIGGAYRKLSAEIEDEVLRIAQECLSNVDRHAAATDVSVDLHYDRDKLTLTVRDDGRGFVKQEAEALQGHYGLRGMKERAATMNGKLTVESKPFEGTKVMLVVPLKAAGEETW